MKRIFPLLISIILLAGLLIGCQDSSTGSANIGNNSNNSNNNIPKSSPTPDNKASSETEPVSSQNPTIVANPNSAMAKLPVIKMGLVLPEVATKDFTGQAITIASRKDTQGQLVTVFAPGCPICHATIPRWITLYQQFFQPRGIPVVAISVQNEGDTAHVIDEFKIPFHVAVMPDVDLRFGYRIPDVPTTFAIGADGSIKGMWVGKPNFAQLAEILKTFCPECTINVTQQS